MTELLTTEPPDSQQDALDRLKAWENGQLNLSPDLLAETYLLQGTRDRNLGAIASERVVLAV